MTLVLFGCSCSVLPNPPALQSTAAQKNLFLETFHWVQTAVWLWQDRSLPCPCHLQRSKEKKTARLQTNAAHSPHARALLEFLSLWSAAQMSQRQQPQSNEQSGRWAPEGALLPLFSGDLAVSHLLCSFGAWFSYWVISEGVSWVLKKMKQIGRVW